MQEMVYWSMLHKIWGVQGNKILLNLIERIESSIFWNLDKKEIQKQFPKIPQPMIDKFIKSRCQLDFDKEIEKITNLNIQVVSIADKSYPKALKNIYDPPPLLYVRGNLKEQELSIAIVGARKASPYGKKVAQDLANQLSARNVQVISGMARGIDTAGHLGAINGPGGTIAVLGSGIDVIYPRENFRLYNSIINSNNSAVISEFPIGIQPLKYHFPLRNRIISGLARGIVVIEAGDKSGSLITAELGLEQGRDVFAVPGLITNLLYKGSHHLIKEGAKLIDCVEDILEEYGWFTLFSKEDYVIPKYNLNNVEKTVLSCLSLEPTSVEEVVAKTNLLIPNIISTLSILEVKGLVKQLAGRKYIKLN